MLIFGKKRENKETFASIDNVKVLGSGCKACHGLYEATRKAARNLDLTITIDYVTDMETIMQYGVMRMPALVINERVVSAGRILKVNEIEKLLRG